MNIAVEQGAPANKSFVEYVNFLETTGYIPPNGKAWVEHIRQKGNEATHEIPRASQDDAKTLITFIEMLLRFVYDFPLRLPPPA